MEKGSLLNINPLGEQWLAEADEHQIWTRLTPRLFKNGENTIDRLNSVIDKHINNEIHSEMLESLTDKWQTTPKYS